MNAGPCNDPSWDLLAFDVRPVECPWAQLHVTPYGVLTEFPVFLFKLSQPQDTGALCSHMSLLHLWSEQQCPQCSPCESSILAMCTPKPVIGYGGCVHLIVLNGCEGPCQATSPGSVCEEVRFIPLIKSPSHWHTCTDTGTH